MTRFPDGVWGVPGPLDRDAPVFRSDGELRQFVETTIATDGALPCVGLLGGDLCRALGGRGDASRLHGDQAWRLPVDVAVVEAAGETFRFTAHLVARSATWSEFAFVMNSEWRGRWDVAPRAHPGDGRLDLVQGKLAAGQRVEAARRARSGTHLPHPDIEVRASDRFSLRWDKPRRVWLDGVTIGTHKELDVRVEPGILPVVVG